MPNTDPNPYADLAVPTPKRKALLTVERSPYGLTVTGPALRLAVRYADHEPLLPALQAYRQANAALRAARDEETTACGLPKGTRGRPGRIEAAEVAVKAALAADNAARDAALDAVVKAVTRLEAERQARLLEALRWVSGWDGDETGGGYYRRTVTHAGFTAQVTSCQGLLHGIELSSDDGDIRIRLCPSYRSRLLCDDRGDERRDDAWEVSMSSCRPRTSADLRLLSTMVTAASDIQADLVSHTVLGDHQVHGLAWRMLEAFAE